MGVTFSKCDFLLFILVFLFAPFLAIAEPALPSAKATVEDTWISKAPMNQTRGSFGVAVVNDKIYAIGGWGGQRGLAAGEQVNYNEEYDPATDTWTYKEPIPTQRSNFAIAVYKNKIYCIGGRTTIQGTSEPTSVSTGINEAYDPATDTWENKTSMPTARWQLTANVVNGKIYLIGGDGGMQVNEAYDPETDTWTKKRSPPTPVCGYASAVVDGKIYLIGGTIGPFDYSNIVQVYDPESNRWSYGTQAPQNAGSASAGATSGVLVPKRVYVFGVTYYRGYGFPGLHEYSIQVYNPENDSWTAGTPPPTNRSSAGVAVINDQLYLVGGTVIIEDGQNSFHATAHAENEQYTPIRYPTPSPSPTPSRSTTTEQPFPTALVAASTASIAVIGVGLLFYFKKRKN